MSNMKNNKTKSKNFMDVASQITKERSVKDLRLKEKLIQTKDMIDNLRVINKTNIIKETIQNENDIIINHIENQDIEYNNILNEMQITEEKLKSTIDSNEKLIKELNENNKRNTRELNEYENELVNIINDKKKLQNDILIYEKENQLLNQCYDFILEILPDNHHNNIINDQNN